MIHYWLGPVSEAATAVFTLALVVGVVFQLRQVRQQLSDVKEQIRVAKKVLEAETYRHLEEKFFHSETMNKTRHQAARDLLELSQKIDASEREAFAKKDHDAFIELAGFFDYIGSLVRLGMIDKTLVYSSFYPKCCAFWQAGEAIISDRRGTTDETRLLWTDFETLTKDLREEHLKTLEKVRPHPVHNGGLLAKTCSAILEHEAKIGANFSRHT